MRNGDQRRLRTAGEDRDPDEHERPLIRFVSEVAGLSPSRFMHAFTDQVIIVLGNGRASTTPRVEALSPLAGFEGDVRYTNVDAAEPGRPVFNFV